MMFVEQAAPQDTGWLCSLGSSGVFLLTTSRYTVVESPSSPGSRRNSMESYSILSNRVILCNLTMDVH